MATTPHDQDFQAARDFKRVAELLDELLLLPGQARATALTALGGDDARLRARLARALASIEREHGGLLGDRAADRYAIVCAVDDEPASSADPAPGSRIGAWRIDGVLGRGGMGVVYAAERADGSYRQEGALKVMRHAIDGALNRELFLRERQILAQLEHPGIARLIDGGVVPDGRPYLVMERIRGKPIPDWCEAHALSVADTLRTFLAVLDAVDVAHRNLIVHGDLKPSNILVTDEGQVKLLDFGVARLLESETADIGGAGLTPRYAAPEQLAGGTLTTATDIHALGLVLCKLLTGRLPEGRAAGESRNPHEITRPSALARMAASGRSDATQVWRRRARILAGDVDAIVLRAIAARPEQRYPTASALAQDIDNYLAGRPVNAVATSRTYRLRRFITRHRAGVGAGIVLLIAALIATAGLGHALLQSRAALAAAERANAVQSFVIDLFREADPAETLGHELTARELLDLGTKRAEQELGEQPQTQADLLTMLAELYNSLGEYDRAGTTINSALAARRAQGATSDPLGLANSLYIQSAILGQQSRYQECVDSAEKARTIVAAHARNDATRNFELLNSLSVCHYFLGNDAEAEKYGRQALAIASANPGVGAARMLDIEDNLGMLLLSHHDDEALPLLQSALEKRRQLLPPRHPDIATSLSNIGRAEIAQGDLLAAARHLREAFEIFLQVYNREYPGTLIAADGLEIALTQLGQLDQAGSLGSEQIQIVRRTLAENDSARGSYTNTFGELALAQGDYSEAEASFRHALQTWRAALGDRHPRIITGERNLADALRQRKRIDEAREHVQASLALARDLYGEDTPETAQGLRIRALIALDGDDFTAARTDLDRAVALSRSVYPKRHPLLAWALIARAQLARRQGHLDDAVRDLDEALSIRVERLGVDSALTVATREALAALRKPAD
ncbi:MAG: serine/threonine-protein kinase [Dokdonella sp.]|uniref:serine/threonine-protein kinase n=1 Tax=Dokdonella sp. TaxID=2291710 RepID=UPI0025C2CBD8|nr:serine/threonine-protein kinase [Dokdonella sp.]MBZ0223831.1 serine/threonine-protein kinase [Dokdonella sp.]